MTYELFDSPYNYDPSDDIEDIKMPNAKFEDGRCFMEGIIEHIYGTGQLNVELLEHCVEELANIFHLGLPRKDLQIM